MATVNDFEELEVWKKARMLQKKVFNMTKLPGFLKDYRLVAQINDAADSTMGNIAEGIERDGHRELIQFLSCAKGSAGEIRSHLWAAFNREYIKEAEFNEARNLCLEVGKMLGGFLRYLKSSQVKGRKYKETG